MVPADDEHMDSTEATSDTNKKEREPARLTPMPGWLMKWWIPILLALILLAAGWLLASIWRMPPRPVLWWTINPYWPPSWPFNYHWPSKDAMALCATIAGGGFAFSAWQQRSHDNATRENEQARAQRELEADRQEREHVRLEQIERDEYWKRREHIFQLLTSKNPALRLSAIELLAELADAAEKSNLLTDTTKQQLQRHIIDTLCLQVRHEGLNISGEGTKADHAELQHEIITAILLRIHPGQHQTTVADWTQETISINNASIITPLTISNTITQATLDFRETVFWESLIITDSSISSIHWDSTRFNEKLEVLNSDITSDLLPHNIKRGRFIKTNFFTKKHALTISFTPHKTSSSISFYECSFYKYECTCLANCSGESHANDNTCTCIRNKKCACNNPCMFADVTIQDYDAAYRSAEDNQRLHSLFIHLKSCTMGALILNFHHAQSNADARRNAIRGRLKIIDEEIRPHPIPSTYCTPELPRFNILDNTIIQAGYQNPVEINIRHKRPVDDFMHFYDNEYRTSNNSNETYPIYYEIDNLNDQPFLFKLTEQDTLDDHKIEWRTGGEY